MTHDVSTFILRLTKLKDAEKSALKRCAGEPLAGANKMALSAFYRCMPRDVPRWQEERWFAIACFRCLWDEPAAEMYPLETVLGKMFVSEELSESVKRRVESLLGCAWEDDNYMLLRLSRLIKMIRQKTSSESFIDFASLLNDLIYWNNSKQTVQRRWARQIFTLINVNEEENNSDAEMTDTVATED